MHRTIRLLGTLVLFLLTGAAGAQSAPAPQINCQSATKPEVDYKTYWDTCNARAAAKRARSAVAAAGPTIRESQTRSSLINWSAVPTWSDADILAQYPMQRDVRYMTGTNNPGFSRRISWMYPDDGCFSRAEQFNVRVAAAGKARPYKLFAFGNWLRINTIHKAGGVQEWAWHVVPVVKRTTGEPIVFDAALSPCRPLNWKKWLALMANDVTLFDTANSGFAVSLADPNGYFPESLAQGEPSHSADSLNDQQTRFLNYEWDRQVSLGRDPNVIFAASPPWSGYACVIPETEYVSNTVAAGTTRTITTNCPFGTHAVGGGQGIPASGFKVTKSVKTSNGWQLAVRNTTGASDTVAAWAICLGGAPTNVQVSSIQGNVVNVAAGSNGTSTASCPTGTLVGGGYSTTDGTSTMRVYANHRTTSTGSTWQASAQNTTGSSKSITAFAYCLPGTNFTFSQESDPVDEWGIAFVHTPPKKVVGGGFYFPRAANYTPTDLYQFGSMTYIVNMAGVPSTGDVTGIAGVKR